MQHLKIDSPSHLTYAHTKWKEVVRPGDTVIDATVGNGHDTTFLASIVGKQGKVIGLDIQKEALESAKKRITAPNIAFYHQSHENFPPTTKVKLIVYNLGYLPGGDKRLTTQTDTTLLSVQKALKIVDQEGMISITCYPGHKEGQKELKALIDFLKTLPKHKWGIQWVRWPKRSDKAPSLVLVSPRASSR